MSLSQSLSASISLYVPVSPLLSPAIKVNCHGSCGISNKLNDTSWTLSEQYFNSTLSVADKGRRCPSVFPSCPLLPSPSVLYSPLVFFNCGLFWVWDSWLENISQFHSTISIGSYTGENIAPRGNRDPLVVSYLRGVSFTLIAVNLTSNSLWFTTRCDVA